MSQSNSHLSRTLTPYKLHPSAPTKVQILQWLHTILPPSNKSLTIEELGNGVSYCRIVNHYAPGTILPSRIITSPINEYEYCLNLKQTQLGLSKLRIHIPFDIHKISKQRFTENWNLISLMYKHLEGLEVKKVEEETILPKRSYPQLPTFERQVALQDHENKLNQGVVNIKMELVSKDSATFVIDRIKQILISNSNDSYKICLIKKLLGIEEKVKLQDELKTPSKVTQTQEKKGPR